MLLGQCTPAAGTTCELPTGLPWYFGLVIAVLWLGLVVGALAVARHLLQARRERRRPPTARRGTDVERW
jgi:hypothetical protein